VPELGIKIKSQDINNNLFVLRFTDKGNAIVLDETYTVEILTKFEKSKSHRLTSATVYRDYARWEFDTSFITQDEKVVNYVYVRKAGSLVVSADANAFAFDVGLSEIDKDAGRVAEVYDENYQKYLDEFAQAEQARKEAEILRQESYDTKVDTALVAADVVGKVDNKVTELTPQINSLTAQLAQTNHGIEDLTKNPTNYKGAIVSIIDDDAMPDFRTVWNSILNDTGAKITVAVITGRVGTTQSLTLQELKDLQAQGHEIVSHTVNHTVTSDVTVQEVESDYPIAKKWMIDNGFEGYNTLVYPGGLHEKRIEIKNVARKYYKYAVATNIGGDYNLSPVDNWRVPRIQGDTRTLAQLKTAVDNAVLNDGWVILMTHSHILQAEGAQKMRDFITYVQGLNVPIMPFGEAAKHKGNAVAIGEFEEDGTFIGMDGAGKIGGSLIVRNTSPNSYNMDEPIMSYRKNAKTIQLLTSVADTFLGIGGVMEVFRGYADAYSYATYKTFNSNKIYMRQWNHTQNVWTTWEGLEKQVFSTGNWTPKLEGISTAGSHTYHTQLGTWTKFANLVTVRFNLRIETAGRDSTMAGGLKITGLPFPAPATGANYAYAPVEYNLVNLPAGYTSVVSGVSGSDMLIFRSGTAVATNYLNASELPETDRMIFRGSLTYQIS